MKKTVKINISGVFFNMDEDAHEILQNYLASVNRKFASGQEGKEIIADIESRIAEILQSKINEQKQVISKEDIDEIIQIMGKPDDFESERESNTYQTTKRLYRDAQNRILGGVCSGMGAYFNVDPLIFRIIFIILLFAWGVAGLIYIVLWALLPAAYTTAQRLEMRGESMSISDIEKNVRSEFESVKSNLNNYRNTKDYERNRNALENLVHAIGQIILVFFKVIGGIIGFAMIVAGVGLLIGLTGWLIVGEAFMPWNNVFIDNQLVYNDMLHSFLDPQTIWIFSIAALLIVFIPLVAIIYGGLKLLLRFKINDKPFAAIGFVLWVASILVVAALSFSKVKMLAISVRDTEKPEISIPANKTFYLKATKDSTLETSKYYIFDDEFSVTYDKQNKKILYALPEIDIVRANDGKLSIEIEKEGRGPNRENALENTRQIHYSCNQQDSIILFDAYFPLENLKIWSFPEVDVTVSVPEGYVIYIDESIKNQIDYFETEEYICKDDRTGKYWIMTKEGFVEREKK